MKPPYTTEPDYKPLSAFRLLGELVLAVIGMSVILGTVAYFVGGW